VSAAAGRTALVLAALAGAGCSGGAQTRPGDYRAQAGALCEQIAGDRGNAPVAEERRRRLLDLVPPPELARAHAELREIAGIVDRVALDAARGQASPARALERIARVRERAGRIYLSIGVPACARA